MLDRELSERVLAAALARGGHFAELFAEDVRSTSAALDDGRVEDLATGHDRGVGVRVVVGDTTGFAHTADLRESGLVAAAEAAAQAAARAGSGAVVRVDLAAAGPRTAGGPPAVDPAGVAKADKVALLRRADATARAAGAAISQVAARYSDTRRQVLVANSEGVFAFDDRTRTLFSVSCVATGDTGMQTGRETVGQVAGFELFDDEEIEAIAQRAAARALTKLAARPAPAATLPVVIGAGSGGVLFHEACGHGLEADLVAKKAS
ncbi:MAG: TldD/PmbA family protein, partial [Acidimicrobiia bacterium]|nr:TldD/PmbA family protein [Acidimicrobiia bacterium]